MSQTAWWCNARDLQEGDLIVEPTLMLVTSDAVSASFSGDLLVTMGVYYVAFNVPQLAVYFPDTPFKIIPAQPKTTT